MAYEKFNENDLIRIHNNIGFLRENLSNELSRRGMKINFSEGFEINKPIRAVHVQELRDNIDKVKKSSYIDNPLIPNINWVKPIHLDQIYAVLKTLESANAHDKTSSCDAGCVGLCASCAGTCNAGNQSAVPPGAPLPDNIAFDDRLPFYMRVYRNSFNWDNGGLPNGNAYSTHERSYNITFKKSGVWEIRFHCDYIYEVLYNDSQSFVNEGMDPGTIARIANSGRYGGHPEDYEGHCDGFWHVVVTGVGEVQWGGDTGRDLTRITRVYIPAGVRNVIFQIAGNDGHSWSRDGLAIINPYLRFTLVG